MNLRGTRRIEFRAPREVYNSIRLITSYTGETRSAFILRAVRAEIEKRGSQMRMEQALHGTVKTRNKRIRNGKGHRRQGRASHRAA